MSAFGNATAATATNTAPATKPATGTVTAPTTKPVIAAKEEVKVKKPRKPRAKKATADTPHKITMNMPNVLYTHYSEKAAEDFRSIENYILVTLKKLMVE